MSSAAARAVLTEASVPCLAPHVRLRFDSVRSRWTVMAPERMLLPDDIAVEVLQRVDGKRSVANVVDELAAAFEADRSEVSADVIDLLQDLHDKGFIAA